MALGDDRRQIAEKIAPWSYKEVLTGTPALTAGHLLPNDYKETLWYDGKAESDAVRIFNHLATADLQVEPEFWPVLMLWLRDEANHSDGFRAMYNTIYGPDPEHERADAAEPSDFEPMSKIVADPFFISIALACDESLTIQNYREYLPQYRAMGEQAHRFVMRLIADEGWHLQKFMKYAAKHHAHRAGDIDAALALCAQADATDYARTFMFDRGTQAGAKQVSDESQAAGRKKMKDLFLRMIAA